MEGIGKPYKRDCGNMGIWECPATTHFQRGLRGRVVGEVAGVAPPDPAAELVAEPALLGVSDGVDRHRIARQSSIR